MHEGIKLIIAVYLGTAPPSRQWDGEGDLGCAPLRLPFTVKCFPVWENRTHLSKPVLWLKWFPVRETSPDSSSSYLSLCWRPLSFHLFKTRAPCWLGTPHGTFSESYRYISILNRNVKKSSEAWNVIGKTIYVFHSSRGATSLFFFPQV